MTRYTYLLIDTLSLAVPLAFSFHPKIKLYKHWDSLLPSILVVAIIYLLWDSLFTKLGIWGFNPVYITGIYIGNLPLEEILFFICIPYACVFTFECLTPFLTVTLRGNNARTINVAFTGVLIIISLLFRSSIYTVSAFMVLAAMVLSAILFKIDWLTKFYVVYSVLLIPFLIVNGLLTGTGFAAPVVWYNQTGIIGLRILTIPVEDVFYGMGLILLDIWIYTFFKTRRFLVDDWPSAG